MKTGKKFIKELLTVGRKAGRCGLVIGEGGNISARCGDKACIKRRNVSMASAKPADYILVDIKRRRGGRGRLKLECPVGSKGMPSTETPMHLACYNARKDIGAVVHTHPVFATALGVSGIKLKPMPYEARAHLKSDIAFIPYIKPGSCALGKAVGRAVKKHNAVILRNHGLVTVGRDIKEAFIRTLAVERAALIYICGKRLQKKQLKCQNGVSVKNATFARYRPPLFWLDFNKLNVFLGEAKHARRRKKDRQR